MNIDASTIPSVPTVASVLDRFLAFFVETVIYLVFIIAWWLVGTLVFDQDLVSSQETWVSADGSTGRFTTWTIGSSRFGFLGWLVYCVYFVCAEVKYGQTLGKRLLGLRVIDQQTGQHPSVSQSIIRLVFFTIGAIALYIPTWIIMASSDRNQRTGDAVARTLVVYR